MVSETWKRLAVGAGAVLVFPLTALVFVLNRVIPSRRDQICQSATQLMALVPGVPGEYLRRAVLMSTLHSCSWDATVGFGTIFATSEVDIGRRVYIGAYCNISHCTIGEDALLGSNVQIVSGRHAHGFERLGIPMRLQERHHERIAIGVDTWIGNGAIIMADVGPHTVIGAGSVVVKPIPALSVAVGNPARVIRQRSGLGTIGQPYGLGPTTQQT